MKMTDEQKAELAQTVAEELPWIDGVTARQAVDVMDDEGALRFRGREVLPDEIPNGAMGRVEYDVLTKNHMTGEFVITRHMEVTSRSGLNLTARPLIDQKVKNVRYFIMEEPKTMREQLVEAFKAAPGSLTDKGLAEYLLARFDVSEKDAEKPKQTIPPQPGHRFKAKTEQGPVAWEFVTLVNDKIICVDERDMTGEVWDRVPFEAAFTVTGVLS